MNEYNLVIEPKSEEYYYDFREYLEGSKENIYRKLLTVIEEFMLSGQEEMKLIVVLKVEKLALKVEKLALNVEKHDYESGIVITKENAIFFMEEFSEYFEEIEDYETCGKILKLFSKR